MWTITRYFFISLDNSANRGMRIASAKHGNGSAAPTTGDPRSVQAVRRAFSADEADDRICSERAKTTSRVTLVRFIHQLPQHDSLLFARRGRHKMPEQFYTMMFIYGMGCRQAHSVHASRIDLRDPVTSAGISRKKLTAGHFFGQIPEIFSLELGRRQIR